MDPLLEHQELGIVDPLLDYHAATKHSPASVQASRFGLDWANQPLPFKVYTSLAPMALPLTFSPSPVAALEAIAGTFPQPTGPLDAVAGTFPQLIEAPGALAGTFPQPAGPFDTVAGTFPHTARNIHVEAEPTLTRDRLARLCYFANGITRVLHRHGQRVPFRAAACTGALYHIELYLVCANLADGAPDRQLLTSDPGDQRSEPREPLGPDPKHLSSGPRAERREPRITLEAGVYHYAAHDNALRLLRRGDFRSELWAASGDEPSIVQAPLVMVCTTTFWRNAWKYQARAYRHAFWDTGTIVANLLGVASANRVSANVVVGFADAPVNELLDLDLAQEVAVCLVALGRGAPAAPVAPPREPLRLPTQPLSAEQVDYPRIVEAHAASSLATGAAAFAWRTAAASPATASPPTASPATTDSSVALPLVTPETHGPAPAATAKNSPPKVTSAQEPPLNAAAADPTRERPAGSIEEVILRRGSARRFSDELISLEQLRDMLLVATRPIPSDFQSQSQSQSQSLTEPYLIVNAVDDLASGAYFFDKTTRSLELLRSGDLQSEAAFLDLGQDLAGQAAINVYWLADLNAVVAKFGSRGYRAAQLEAAIEGGKLYLAAYALGLGAIGLTFFDDEVTRFFSPHAASKSVMFLVAVGHSAKRSTQTGSRLPSTERSA